MFNLGRLCHLTIDAIMVSMILAGIKLATGYELRPDVFGHNPDSVGYMRKYLKFGEYLFQAACNKAVNSKSFKRINWKEMSDSFSKNLLSSTRRMMDDFQKKFDDVTGNKIEEL